ncbi:SGNH/GDSL hydrolase family protein [Rhodococcus sp. 14-2483-1-2]|uniref:SGNH/GDSL hydrolase family protein n=1 Tax=Rhodococcus sp. 14-2483-1-2 TaxID=2023147 RepID=UPI0011406006|nr:SGNH/GDSL hydrolase family protein [Rhodococcus sp. 14-2483-1-2]
MSTDKKAANLAQKLLLFSLALVLTSCSSPNPSETPDIDAAAPQSELQPSPFTLPDLSDDSTPFKIVLLGDNTSKLDGGWTNIFANWLSTRYDRTVVVNGIEDGNATSYSVLKTIGQGSRTPIEVWNSAVPNLTVQQFAERLNVMLPFDTGASPDLIIFSQGHNSGTRSLARTAIPVLKSMRATYPQSAIIAVLQNPWLAQSDSQNTNSLNIQDLRTSAKNSGFATIDVYSAFRNDARPLETLLDTGGTFPSADGYILWAQVMESELQ